MVKHKSQPRGDHSKKARQGGQEQARNTEVETASPEAPEAVTDPQQGTGRKTKKFGHN